MSTLNCAYFQAQVCGSCTQITTPYELQLAAKDQRARSLVDAAEWLPAVAGGLAHFRTKVKLVVGGTADEPTLGILDERQRGVDLAQCPIVDTPLSAGIPALRGFIRLARICPYDVPARRGELKNVIVTSSPAGELMVRFVLRSTESVPRIRKHLPVLMAQLPNLRVVTVNLLPEHKAVLEGSTEIVLTEADSLRMDLGERTLHLLPQSFFQTNTTIAEQLYERGAAWVDEVGPASVWDLYCGVGGFALYVAAHGRTVTGVELSKQAVASATRSAAEAGASASFVAADATSWARSQQAPPELVIVNPPRRGIGAELASWLETSAVECVLYSSCNLDSLAADLAATPSLRPARAQVFDMFPHTSHFETLVLLRRCE